MKINGSIVEIKIPSIPLLRLIRGNHDSDVYVLCDVTYYLIRIIHLCSCRHMNHVSQTHNHFDYSHAINFGPIMFHLIRVKFRSYSFTIMTYSQILLIVCEMKAKSRIVKSHVCARHFIHVYISRSESVRAVICHCLVTMPVDTS